jgi:hypothetical protein
MGRFATDITTVSKPKMKPANAAINDIPNKPSLNFVLFIETES